MEKVKVDTEIRKFDRLRTARASRRRPR